MCKMNFHVTVSFDIAIGIIDGLGLGWSTYDIGSVIDLERRLGIGDRGISKLCLASRGVCGTLLVWIVKQSLQQVDDLTIRRVLTNSPDTPAIIATIVIVSVMN